MAFSKAVGALAISKARGVVVEGTSKGKDTRKGPTEMVMGVALPPQVGLAWGSGSGLAKEAEEAGAGIVKVPGGTRVKTLNPWGRS